MQHCHCWDDLLEPCCHCGYKGDGSGRNGKCWQWRIWLHKLLPKGRCS